MISCPHTVQDGGSSQWFLNQYGTCSTLLLSYYYTTTSTPEGYTHFKHFTLLAGLLGYTAEREMFRLDVDLREEERRSMSGKTKSQSGNYWVAGGGGGRSGEPTGWHC